MRMQFHRTWSRALPPLVAAAVMAAAVADPALGAESAPLERQPQSLGLGFERWTLPGAEKVGMAHGHLLFEVAPDWWVGPSVLGAASGQRGGWFVGALTVQRPLTLWPGRLWLLPSLSAGGGGGAAAPVGSGLMLRSSLTLSAPMPGGRIGLTWSDVRFSGTELSSRQFGLRAEWHRWFQTQPSRLLGQALSVSGRSGLGFDRMALLGGRYALKGSSGASVPLVGVRLERLHGEGGSHGVEALASAGRGSAGYMELLAHLSQRWHPLPQQPLQLGVRAAVGLGGGGAVPTGAGPIAHAGAFVEIEPLAGWQVGASLGRVAGRSSALRGNRAELWLAADLEPKPVPGSTERSGVAHRLDWAGLVQHSARVQRVDGRRDGLQSLALQLNLWLGPQAYVTGQAHTAVGGGAGAWGMGLVGAGWASRPDGGWQYGAEALAGAAGGGGVDSLAGPVSQAMLWLAPRSQAAGQDLRPHWRLSLGAVQGRSGGTQPAAGLAWVLPLAQVLR